jgi:hypothetical protein
MRKLLDRFRHSWRDAWGVVGRDETRYLLSFPKNAERLRRSIEEMDAGKGVEHEVIETAKGSRRS